MKQITQPISKRQRILEVAEALLRDQGYLGVSMEQVARGAGLKKAGLYHHFPKGKEEMMLDIAEQVLARDEIGFSTAVGTNSGVQAQLTAIARWVFTEQHHTQRMLRDALRFMSQDHQDQLFRHFQDRLFAQVKAVFEAGIQSGELRILDTQFATWAFMGLVSEFATITQWQTFDALPEKVIELLGYGIYSQEVKMP